MTEARRDHRPEGSALLECTMVAGWATAVQLATIATRHGHQAFIDTKEMQLRAGEGPVPFHSIRMGE